MGPPRRLVFNDHESFQGRQVLAGCVVLEWWANAVDTVRDIPCKGRQRRTGGGVASERAEKPRYSGRIPSDSVRAADIRSANLFEVRLIHAPSPVRRQAKMSRPSGGRFATGVPVRLQRCQRSCLQLIQRDGLQQLALQAHPVHGPPESGPRGRRRAPASSSTSQPLPSSSPTLTASWHSCHRSHRPAPSLSASPSPAHGRGHRAGQRTGSTRLPSDGLNAHCAIRFPGFPVVPWFLARRPGVRCAGDTRGGPGRAAPERAQDGSEDHRGTQACRVLRADARQDGAATVSTHAVFFRLARSPGRPCRRVPSRGAPGSRPVRTPRSRCAPLRRS